MSLKCYHGEINIAGIKFHVDLLVDQSFALFMKVLADSGTHLDVEDVFCCRSQKLVSSTHSGVASYQLVR